MKSTIVGIIAFTCTFGGALLGMWLYTTLPADHLAAESKDTVRIGVGFIATMTALVLGFVTGSAKSSFDAVATQLKRTSGDILALDRLLARYGSEAGELRKHLQHMVEAQINKIWPTGSSKPTDLDPMHSGAWSEAEGLANAIRSLKPRDDSQRALQSRALDLSEAVLQARWLPFAGAEPSVHLPFLVALLFWLTVIFASFGLFAPRNGTVLAVLLICALSVGGDLFLILEMDRPFDGLLKVSAGPLRYAQTHLNQ